MEYSSNPDRSRIGARDLVPREGRNEYLQPSYGISFKSVLIVVLVMIALIAGAILIFA